MTKSKQQKTKQPSQNNNKQANKKQNKNKNNVHNVNSVNNNFRDTSDGRMLSYSPKPAKKMTTSKLSLTRCALKFAIACADPFSQAARGSCVPYGSEATMKTSAFTRFDVVIGTGGYAAVIVCPSLAKDAPIAFATNATYNGTAGTGLFPFNTVGSNTTGYSMAAGWDGIFPNNLPFKCSDFAGYPLNTAYDQEGIVGRIVAGGLRAQYVGTTLNQSGVFACFTSPHHASLSGNHYTNTVGVESDTVIRAVDREPCTTRWFPITDLEQAMGTEDPLNDNRGTMSFYPLSVSSNSWLNPAGANTNPQVAPDGVGCGVGAPISVTFVTGVPGQIIHFELVQHVEYSGPRASNMLTPVTADPVGAKQVIKAAASMPAKIQASVGTEGHNNTESLWSVMYDSLKEVAHETITYGVPALARGVATLLA